MSDDLFDVFNEAAPAEALELSVQPSASSQPAGPTEPDGTVSTTQRSSHALDAPTLPSPSRGVPVSAAPVPLSVRDPAHAAAAEVASHRGSASPSAPPTTAGPTPTAVTIATSTLAGSSSSGGGVMIIHSKPSTTASSPSAFGLASHASHDGGSVRPAAAAAAPAVVTEDASGIRVRRATLSLEQFSVRLAEFPFAAFDVFRGLARRSEVAVAHTCVGVVTRKSNPKQSMNVARAAGYAVLTLWSMHGISPNPASELSFLLCGTAFELLYSRLVTGSVVALSNVARCTRKAASNSTSTTADAPDEVLLRVSDSESVRELGFAADLGTCASVSYTSKERCNAVINARYGQHCAYHVADLRKAARGATAVGGTPKAPPTTSTSEARTLMKGGALTTHMAPTGAQQRLAVLAPGGAARRTAEVAVRSATSAAAPHAAPVNGRLVAAQQMLRQQSFFAVRGGSGLPTEDAAHRSTVSAAGSGVYGGVSSGAPLPLRQQVGLRPAASYPSAQTLGVTSRGRDVLEAARQQAVHDEEARLLRRPLRGAVSAIEGTALKRRAGEAVRASTAPAEAPKRARAEEAPVSAATTTGSTAAPAGADGGRVAALRQQFQPLHRGTPAAFTPLSSHGAVHAVVASVHRHDYRHSVVMPESTGAASRGALLRAAAKAAKDVTSASSPATREGSSGDALALTLLGAVADNIASEHDHLRHEAELQRLRAFADKQITKEKALAALEAITEQQVKAHYCYGCRCWYARPPTTCLEQHHRLELKPALKKYIKCEHCGYKTFVIGGDEATGWRVYPRCPRCHESSFWVRGDAAPQIAAVVEAPPPA